ncbi:hypothetical protein QAD02_024023 [Eretmocerus hayati]|uniref:Uncharacterized protein n=1 Tax=Eretmocerus hayati TaxID=131215 RepID=A0ACC2PZ46_9HYME|nr:hypothetical protein QAD02_024023 [Eretmocerus hayati]
MWCRRLSNRKILVDILALLFGIGAWVGVNGIYVQLPLLVDSSAEKWTLPAYMVMIVQLANSGPVLYTLYVKYLGCFNDKYIIYGLLGAATLSTYVLAFSYEKTTIVFGEKHSTALLGLMLVAAFVGCTSSVLFMPYMRNYREIYLVSYLVGEGLSGFLPSIVALIQGVGENPVCVNVTKSGSSDIEFEVRYSNPRFSTQSFFLFLGTLLFLSAASFIGLNKLSVAKGERVRLPSNSDSLPTDTSAPPSYKTAYDWNMSNRSYILLLVMMALACCLGNGILPSIQSYSCLPYGNEAYHLTVTLASMAGPLAMCSGFFFENQKVPLLSSMMVFVLMLSSFVFYTALKSPMPPLQGTWLGQFLIVSLWILVSGSIGFIKMGITTLFRPDPGKGLYYTGVATQVGSLVGAVLTFTLVNYTKMFQEYSPCDALKGH